ncbi:MAG TPA: hypothetical protein DC048_03940, partial [Planctomycetaceae bacterium]|nr:hypothetical protein [Planctomycetaceae bacterium]
MNARPYRLPTRPTVLRSAGRAAGLVILAALAGVRPTLAADEAAPVAQAAPAQAQPAPAAPAPVRPVDFDTQVVPIFTKHGCNGGGCHGKSGGQNGFRLSLLGFEPGEDHDHLVKEARGRRISVAAPAESLLLLKAAAIVPHGGGKLIEPGSPSHEVIVRWIAEGAKPGDPAAPRVARIEVSPPELVMKPGGSQQLRVIAHLTDGTTEDVTRLTQYESNVPELASVDTAGLVSASPRNDGPPQSGTVAVMARYQSRVAVFRASLPLETPADKLPAPESFVRTFVDKHV